MRIAVYTSFSQGYDDSKPLPPAWRAGARCVAFTPDEVCDGWEKQALCSLHNEPRMNAKFHKVMSHECLGEVDCSVWIDGSVRVKSRLAVADFVEEALEGHSVAVYRHRRRRCVYAEAVACMLGGKEKPARAIALMRRYWASGYPRNNGLAECSVIVRRHSRETARFNALWFSEILRFSSRDQLSFNVAATHAPVRVAYMPGTILNNAHFERAKHTGLG